VYGANDLLCAGVDCLKGFAVDTLDELSVDKAVVVSVLGPERLPEFTCTYRPVGCSYLTPVGRVIVSDRDMMRVL
jgi:hypothetical protein